MGQNNIQLTNLSIYDLYTYPYGCHSSKKAHTALISWF